MKDIVERLGFDPPGAGIAEIMHNRCMTLPGTHEPVVLCSRLCFVR